MQLPKIFPVTSHTDHVGHGSTFVAISGQKCDGMQFIPLALERGATKIVVSQDALLTQEIKQKIEHSGAHLMRVANTRAAVAQLSAHAFDYPANKLKIIGITGTKGKTTSSYVVEHIFSSAGYKTALISTVGNKINGCSIPGALTTPLPEYLHVFFNQCVQVGVDYVIMEISAQALTLSRVEGIYFEGIIFTNFSQEHAEFYSSMNDYFYAKSMIFNHLKSGACAVINADDAWCQKISAYTNTNCVYFGLKNQADVMACDLQTDLSGLSFKLKACNDSTRISINCSTLVGEFNAYNVLGCITLAHQLGIAYEFSARVLKSMPSVPGRLQHHALSNGAHCFIDYAHNPSSYQAVLGMLRSVTHQLIVVFGAGGERDHTKRPEMGRIAAQLADVVILTTDNPRSEDPIKIIDDIIVGIAPECMHKVVRVLDRAAAIEHAHALSAKGAVIALLGKGPDEYQLIGNKKIPFSERQLIYDLEAAI